MHIQSRRRRRPKGKSDGGGGDTALEDSEKAKGRRGGDANLEGGRRWSAGGREGREGILRRPVAGAFSAERREGERDKGREEREGGEKEAWLGELRFIAKSRRERGRYLDFDYFWGHF
ncbi:hypothetical protein BT93_F3218 [Corymbia citriodora subsp. variegata]|nr:hypothetical protein BT93_F3218 [Corymbia citriodora subsp. variegata]